MISYLKSFGCKCYVLNNDKENLGKFDSKSDEGIFLSYSLNFRPYHIFNHRTLTVKESPHILCDESNPSLQINSSDDGLNARNAKNIQDDHHNFLSDIMSKNEEKDQKYSNLS